MTDLELEQNIRILYLLKLAEAAKEMAKFYEEVVKEFYSEGLDDNGEKARTFLDTYFVGGRDDSARGKRIRD